MEQASMPDGRARPAGNRRSSVGRRIVQPMVQARWEAGAGRRAPREG